VEKRVGGKYLAGNALEVQKRQIAQGMARFVRRNFHLGFRKWLDINVRKFTGCEQHAVHR
jgi:hypothetical protein